MWDLLFTHYLKHNLSDDSERCILNKRLRIHIRIREVKRFYVLVTYQYGGIQLETFVDGVVRNAKVLAASWVSLTTATALCGDPLGNVNQENFGIT